MAMHNLSTLEGHLHIDRPILACFARAAQVHVGTQYAFHFLMFSKCVELKVHIILNNIIYTSHYYLLQIQR